MLNRALASKEAVMMDRWQLAHRGGKNEVLIAQVWCAGKIWHHQQWSPFMVWSLSEKKGIRNEKIPWRAPAPTILACDAAPISNEKLKKNSLLDSACLRASYIVNRWIASSLLINHPWWASDLTQHTTERRDNKYKGKGKKWACQPVV